MIKKAIYEIRDRKLPKQIRERIHPDYSGNSYIPPGWKNLVVMLHNELAELCPEYELHQVKSKFGTLRYYIAVPSEVDEVYGDKIYDTISKYEALSKYTCEVCGQPADRGANALLVFTRCDKHKE